MFHFSIGKGIFGLVRVGMEAGACNITVRTSPRSRTGQHVHHVFVRTDSRPGVLVLVWLVVVRVTVGVRSHGGLDFLVGQLVPGAHGDITDAQALGPGVDGADGTFGHLLQFFSIALDAATLGLGYHLEGAADADDVVNRRSFGGQQLVEQVFSSLAESCAELHVDVTVVQFAIAEVNITDGDGLDPDICQGTLRVLESDRTYQLYPKNGQIQEYMLQ